MKNPPKSQIFPLKSNRTPNLTLNLNRSKKFKKMRFNGTSPQSPKLTKLIFSTSFLSNTFFTSKQNPQTPSQQNFYFWYFLKNHKNFLQLLQQNLTREPPPFITFPPRSRVRFFLFWRSPFFALYFSSPRLQAPSSAVPDINPTLPQPAPAVLVLTGTNPTSSKLYQRPFTF